MTRNRLGILSTAICSILCFTSVDTYAFSEGYFLTGTYGGTSTILFDSLGNEAFKWDHSSLPNPKNGYSSYLLKNGNLLRSACVPDGTINSQLNMQPVQGILEEIDRNGKVVWSYQLASDNGMLHHDMKMMPNGNIIGVVFVPLTKAKMKEKGIDTSLVKSMQPPQFILSEKIVEIEPDKANGGGKIVWEWCLHDHVIPDAEAADHPELFSGSIVKTLFSTTQWVHLNGIDYNAELDMILFSSRVFSECYMIDHSTTTEEAAGHTGGNRGKGGDLLYRWGNPANYKASGATKLTVLHCVNWIPKNYPGAGNVIFFHNNTEQTPGTGGPAKTYSQVVEIKPPMDDQGNFTKTSGQPFAPSAPTWLFAPTTDSLFSSGAMSSAFRMPNGNTIAHVAYPPSKGSSNPWGPTAYANSMIYEIDKNKNIVWKDSLVMEKTPSSMGVAFNPAKIMYYEKNYDGVKKLLGGTSIDEDNVSRSHANLKPVLSQSSGSLLISGIEGARVDILTMQGRKIRSVKATSNFLDINLRGYSAGHYYARIFNNNRVEKISTFNIIK